MGILCIACRVLCFFVWRIGGFCSLVVLRLFCMCNQILLVLVETAKRAEKSPSFPARIDRNRQSLLHGGFFVVGVLALVCGFFGRISHSIDRSRLHVGVGFGLAYFCIGLKDK